MSHFPIELIAGSLFCLVHLAIGLAVGARFGQATVRYVALTHPSTDRSAGQRISSQWFELCLRLSEMASCTNELRQLPADLMSQWRSELLRLTDELSHALERDRWAGQVNADSEALAPTSINASPDDTPQPEQEVVTNNQILDLLEKHQADFVNHDESTPLVRYRFSAKQPLAPAHDSRPLSAEAFSMVQFHDLSVRDVRFFLDDRPVADNVVIGLGVPQPVKWIAAKIDDYRSAFMYGRVGYLVTARLLASLDKRPYVSTGFVKQSTTESSP